MKGYTFILTVNLDEPSINNQHDVAAALRNTAEKLDKYISAEWTPYSMEGNVLDDDGQVVGSWKVKGPHDDRDE